MKRSHALILAALFIVAVAVRLYSLPERPFFCDVPGNVAAVETGSMRIQFPGYVPFHLVVKVFAVLLNSAFAGDILFSLLCGMGAWIYCVLFARERAGFQGALLTAAVMGLSPLAIYFSCVGASYTTDFLAMSAMLYHGNRALTEKRDPDFYYAILWFAFGYLMRSLSFPLAGLGVIYLCWRFPTRRHIIFTITTLTVATVILAATTLYFFGGLKPLLNTIAAVQNQTLHRFSITWQLRNVGRCFIFTVWALNVYILVLLSFLWTARMHLNRSLSIYFALLSVPYMAYIAWAIPHAGYICEILPVLVCAPYVAEKRFWLDSKVTVICLIFVLISMGQFFVARPIPFTGMKSLVLNCYVLTYTREGIKQGMFDNLTAWSARTHIN